MDAKPKHMTMPTAQPPGFDETAKAQIIELLGPVPMTVDDVIEQSGASVQQVHLVLLQLDLSGRLTTKPGGKISLI